MASTRQHWSFDQLRRQQRRQRPDVRALHSPASSGSGGLQALVHVGFDNIDEI